MKDPHMNQPMNETQLSRIVLKGFKSIAKCDLELSRLNVLIGCNGAGKSNFISLFTMIHQMLEGQLQRLVGREGGPDALLHFGRKTTEQLTAELHFGRNGYRVTLEATRDNRLMFADEEFWRDMSQTQSLGSGHFEARITKGDPRPDRQHALFPELVPPSIPNWRVYHFHDTSESAKVKQVHGINDNAYLRPDASNLAAYLYLLRERHPDAYRRITRTIQLVAPFFGDFHLRPSPQNEDKIELEWVEQGQDIPFKAHQLSDGTLRFICLATLFLQPPSLQPEIILVDEPELGLHPYAITVLASLMRSASHEKQVIVSTQSVGLLNEFTPADVVVVDREDGRSTLRLLDEEALAAWLEDYSLGELWQKNVLGGRPAR